MYQITRKNRIKETLRLCHADGTTALDINVDLNVDEIAARVSKAYEVLAMSQNALQKDPGSPEAREAYGRAVLAVFTVIFGEDDTRRLMDFYEGNYTELLLDIFPFINDEIMPKIKEASNARKEQLIAATKAARKNARGWK